MLTDDQWHTRFCQQAEWTAAGREYIYTQIGLKNARRILEVGCGTGAILQNLDSFSRARIFGIDLRPGFLTIAQSNSPSAYITCSNVNQLPFPDNFFDIILCHFFLMWVSPTNEPLNEMIRVTREDGIIAALAEPDYGGRINYPEVLDQPGELQEEALRDQGAETRTGRRLSSILSRAGLVDIHHGVLGGEWHTESDLTGRMNEWMIMKSDIEDTADSEQIATWQGIDQQAWHSGERVLYVPTFYAWGKVV